MIEIYFTRESLCMADDVNAPNIAKVILPHPLKETEFHKAVLHYCHCSTSHSWRGYTNSILICEINNNSLSHTGQTVSLKEDWQQYILKYRTVHFVHEVLHKDNFPYSFHQCEKIFQDARLSPQTINIAQ